jgi:hypothetical protein
MEIAPGGSGAIPLHIKAKDRPGEHKARLRIHTDHPQQPTVDVDVTYEISDPKAPIACQESDETRID